MTFATTPPPPPLTTIQFYILLALARDDLHGYAISGSIYNNSLGSIRIKSGSLYPALAILDNHAFIEPGGTLPAGKSRQPRYHYAITQHGRIRLQEELIRMKHAVAIGTEVGLLDNSTPTDIQRLLLELEVSPDRP